MYTSQIPNLNIPLPASHDFVAHSPASQHLQINFSRLQVYSKPLSHFTSPQLYSRMTSLEPSDTIYEMTLIKGLTLRWKERLMDDAFLQPMNQLCQDLRDMHDDEWQVVTSRELRIFMDGLLTRNWRLHVGDGAWTDWPQTSEVHVDGVGYEYVWDWHDGQNAERLAFFADPQGKAPLLCARKHAIDIQV